ncbi:hypothetical protein NGH40_09270 [Staphylococcus succinus]|nr:hypothetical protein [Staphylococcus succinus]
MKESNTSKQMIEITAKNKKPNKTPLINFIAPAIPYALVELRINKLLGPGVIDVTKTKTKKATIFITSPKILCRYNQ